MRRLRRFIPTALIGLTALLTVGVALGPWHHVWGQPPITPNNARFRGAALGANPAIVVEGLDAAIGLEVITVGTDPFILTVPGGLTITQGALTAAAPNLSGTATWNAGAVVFTGFRLNVTDTASAAASLLEDLQVGGVSQWQVTKAGVSTQLGGANLGAATALTFTGRARLSSSADGIAELMNNAATDFTRLNLGPAAVTNPSLFVAPAIAGQTQGVAILRGDGTAQVFASLGAAANGTMIYCSDCTFASPCAGAGTGAIAKRLAGAWRCD